MSQSTNKCCASGRKAADELVKNYDWEDEFPQDIEIENIKEVTEDEALEYDVYEA